MTSHLFENTLKSGLGSKLYPSNNKRMPNKRLDSISVESFLSLAEFKKGSVSKVSTRCPKAFHLPNSRMLNGVEWKCRIRLAGAQPTLLPESTGGTGSSWIPGRKFKRNTG